MHHIIVTALISSEYDRINDQQRVPVTSSMEWGFDIPEWWQRLVSLFDRDAEGDQDPPPALPHGAGCSCCQAW